MIKKGALGSLAAGCTLLFVPGLSLSASCGSPLSGQTPSQIAREVMPTATSAAFLSLQIENLGEKTPLTHLQNAFGGILSFRLLFTPSFHTTHVQD